MDQEFRSREGSSGELVTYDYTTSIRERRNFPKIDYSTKSDEDVCVEEQHRNSDWPSWLPDWSMWHRAGKLCKKQHHNGRWNFSASGKSQAAASILFVDAGHREKPILRACGVRFKRLEIMDIEFLPHNGDMINGILAGVKDKSYPGRNISYQDAVNELVSLVIAPYADGAPYEPIKKHTHDELLARVSRKMSGSKLGLSGLTSFSVYRDANGFIRKFFLSRSGYIGLAPLRAEKRDEICILFGAKTPTAIRDKGEYYEFIGECLVLGVMEGELIKNLNGDYVENLEFL